MTDPKPLDYHERRRWQDAARARGEVPECGRMACRYPVNRPARVGRPAVTAYLNHHTPLLYCERCADQINAYAPPDAPLCYPEAPHAD